jgi:hypothetical protein
VISQAICGQVMVSVRYIVDKVDAHLDNFPGARIVRWPFRNLAAILVVASSFIILVSSNRAVAHHDAIACLDAVLFLPVTALFVRTCGAAVLFGRVAATPLWPFAQGYAAFVWVLVVLVVTQQYA